MSIGIALAERGWLSDGIVRLGIRRLLKKRLSSPGSQITSEEFLRQVQEHPIALDTDKANEQHYMLPPEFFVMALGEQLKYSCCLFGYPKTTLDEAEEAMLALTAERAEIRDGMAILDLGCGWGSFSLYVARKFPNCRIHAVSNSSEQREFIEKRCETFGIRNLTVTTADINEFEPGTKFDRIVSVEMFEHIRNHRAVLDRVNTWLNDQGKLFVHIFCHDRFAYAYETEGSDNWMGRYFFTGGTMPSFDLLGKASDLMQQEKSWRVLGTHYARTSRGWLENMDRHRDQIFSIFEDTYGSDAAIWVQRWRMFFMACEELFAYNGGREWFVGHYLLEPVRSGTTVSSSFTTQTEREEAHAH